MSLGQTILEATARDAAAQITIQRSLEAVRSHLGMEVAYLSEFVGDQSIFRSVDAPGLEALIKPGDSRPLDDVYCRHILAGRLPELMPDTSLEPLAMSMQITHAVPIGAHVSVPIRLPDGRPYGMFCCLSPHANSLLNERDLQVMKLFADIAGHQINRDIEGQRSEREKRTQIGQVISEEAYSLVFQPIWDFAGRTPVGFKSLCRFKSEPYRSPDKWFGDAASAGLGSQLEAAVIRSALREAQGLPDDIYVSINTSPETVLNGSLQPLLADLRDRKLVIEITEHAPVDDYQQLAEALRPLREQGILLAIDDAGAGFSSLQHIVQLRPDIIKLDMSLTRAVDSDPARRALAAALIFFAREVDCLIIAEGIETESERATLHALGITKGQGYLLGRPAGIEAAKEWFLKPPRRISA